MSAADDRIVSMHFDNAEFQKNAADTLRTLEVLKKSLNFDASTKAIGDMSDASKGFNLDHMTTAIEGVSGKFLALSTVAITVLSNITTKALDAGMKVVKAFAVEPITSGFSEYETKIGSIQTILANTARYGTKLPEVEANLEKLNAYADRTIYSFGDMTKNIGLFTNAGIKVGDATSMIKGFSNAAAASGTTAEGAAGAAYQLSQALSAGQIRLMDWKSLTNVGMGNKNMQDSLIQIAKGMGVFEETGDDANEVAKNFNASLETGWLKADVMSNYLRIMAGEMSDAEMASKGLTTEQIKGLKAQAATAEDAATKVRTFTQLTGTLKESVGSGWAETFGIIFGNFEGATTLFTGISKTVGGIAENFSKARNDLLRDWDKFGGRVALFEGVKDVFSTLFSILKSVSKAFRDIFPAKTGQDLAEMSKHFGEFAENLRVATDKILPKITLVFKGLFAAIEIGWTIVKEVVSLFGDLFSVLTSGAGSPILDFFGKMAEKLIALNKILVTEGGIHKFFEGLRDPIQGAGEALDRLKDKIIGFFKGSDDAAKDSEDGVNRITKRVDNLTETWNKALDAIQKFWNGAKDTLGKIWGYITGFFSTIGEAIAAGFQSGNFDKALDLLNVGLLGGIVLMLKKFFDHGLKVDFTGGVLDKIKGALDGVKDSLKAMETQLKAKALMEIAIAMGVLTLSIIALSLIDSGALARSLGAIAIGFGELVGVLALLDKIGGGGKSGIGKIGALTLALIAIASASVILAGAIALMAQLDPKELATGLAGITAALILFVGAVKVIGEEAGKSIGASVAIFAMARSLVKFATGVKMFGEIPWQQLVLGLGAMAAVLTMLVIAMNKLPRDALGGLGLAMAATGILIISGAMVILAGAVKIFASMPLAELAQGVGAIGVLLLALGFAVQNMPATLPIIAVGLILLGIGLTALMGVVAVLGQMKLGTLAKGIGAMGAMLVILGIAMIFMETALPGAAATLLVAVALAALTKVIKTLGEMDIKTLVIGLVAMAAVLAVLGLAAFLLEPLLPAMFALGIALGTIGIAFALFGVGAYLAAKAFEVVAHAGKVGIEVIIDSIMLFLKAIPKLVGALIEALTASTRQFLEIGSQLMSLAAEFLGKMLDVVIKIAPKIAEAILVIVTKALELIREKIPDIVETGFVVLTAFLKGLLDHIEDVASLGVKIVAKLVNTIANNVQLLVDAAINLLTAFIRAIINRIQDLVGLGGQLLMAVIAGIAGNIMSMINLGGDIIAFLIHGIALNLGKVVRSGADAIIEFMRGMGENVNRVISAGVDLVLAIMKGLSDNLWRLIDGAARIVTDFLNGLADIIRRRGDDLRKAGLNILTAIIDGMTGGMASKMGEIGNGLVDGAKKAVDKVKGFLGIHSPSTLFAWIGKNMMLGWSKAIGKDTTAEDSIVTQAEKIITAFQETLSTIPDTLAGMDEMNPVITPVLDLSQVAASAKGLNQLMSMASISAGVSIDQARVISTTSQGDDGPSEPVQPEVRDVKFEQNIYSPKALSTNDVYRNTNSQIALAKEELKIT